MARPRPLADLLDACLKPALRAQGFAAADIVVAWPEIVGSRLAAFSHPLQVKWQRRGESLDYGLEPATLIVRVESAFALEMQHLAPVVLERVNAHYGWRCVGRLVIKQGPVARPAARPAKPEARLSAEERRRVDTALSPIADEGLRSALDRLGEAVVAAEPHPEEGAPAPVSKPHPEEGAPAPVSKGRTKP